MAKKKTEEAIQDKVTSIKGVPVIGSLVHHRKGPAIVVGVGMARRGNSVAEDLKPLVGTVTNCLFVQKVGDGPAYSFARAKFAWPEEVEEIAATSANLADEFDAWIEG